MVVVPAAPVVVVVVVVVAVVVVVVVAVGNTVVPVANTNPVSVPPAELVANVAAVVGMAAGDTGMSASNSPSDGLMQSPVSSQ